MRGRKIERVGLMAVIATVCAGSACEALVGIQDTTEVDAEPSGYLVRGTAVGLLAPLSLRLEYSGGSEFLSITQDGTFAFNKRLNDGDLYVVMFVGLPPCILHGGAGVITGTNPELALTCEGVVGLDLAISGPPMLDLTLSPTQLAYVANVSRQQESTIVTATSSYPEANITVNGTSVTSGAPSAPLALSLGDNILDVAVTHPGGFERSYQVTIRRVPDIAQYVYGKASNTDAGDYFGYSMALDGDTLAVGAYREASAATGVDGDQADNSAGWSGAVYVFRRSGTEWQQEAYIKASNAGAGDGFGWSVTLDGDTLAVGAPYEDSAATGVNGNQAGNSATESGAVYVFRRSGTEWQQEAYVKASNTGAGDQFGFSVALDGDTLAVGARYESSAATGVNGNQADDSATESGAVYVFRRSGTEWQQEAYVKASNTDEHDKFGWSVALDGDTLAVGAYWENSAATGVNGNQDDNNGYHSGAVYVFRRSETEWQQEAYIKASNTGGHDWFGASVALDGDTLAVVADGEDSAATGINGNQADNSATNSGAVYVFRRSGTEWQQEVYVKASNTDEQDNFGWSVALDGDTLAVGARWEDSAAKGVNGNQADNSVYNSGAVYVFRRSGIEWQQEAYVKASNPDRHDWFGSSVALDGDTLAVGAYWEGSAAMGINGNQADNSASQSGAVYIFH
jgi:trimeric autotransporter adhesin